VFATRPFASALCQVREGASGSVMNKHHAARSNLSLSTYGSLLSPGTTRTLSRGRKRSCPVMSALPHVASFALLAMLCCLILILSKLEKKQKMGLRFDKDNVDEIRYT
jgi:hypothetical protein